MKQLIPLLFCLLNAWTFAQNDSPKRDAFTLTLPVDSVNYYQQEIAESPYFVKENVLQIYPGEHLFIEVETSKKGITSMKVVKENLNPKKTIEVSFDQLGEERKHEGMMLQVTNPFSKELSYGALMFIVGNDNLLKTSIVPVAPKLSGYEMWNDVIISLVLIDWTLN